MDTVFDHRFTATTKKEVMQEYLYKQLALSPESTFTKLSKIIYAIIFLSIISIVLESEITIYAGNESLFIKINYFFGIVFLIVTHGTPSWFFHLHFIMLSATPRSFMFIISA